MSNQVFFSDKIQELKDSVLELVSENDYDIKDIYNLIDPAIEYIDNDFFVSHVKQLVSIFLVDRNKDNKFSLDDIKCMSKDILSITSLVTGIVLLLGSLPTFKLKYNGEATEEIIFKILVYIFLVMIPVETGKKWNYEEKESLLNQILVIYQLIMSAQITQNVLDTVIRWFKQKGFCKCLTDDKIGYRHRVIERKFPIVKEEIKCHVNKLRETRELQNQVILLRSELKKIKKITKN